MKAELLYIIYVVAVTSIVTAIFITISPSFYAYMAGLFVGLSIGFLTEGKFKNFIYKNFR